MLKKLGNTLITLIIVFFMLLFNVGCENGLTYHDDRIVREYVIHEDGDTYSKDDSIYFEDVLIWINGPECINLDDFLDNPNLSVEENEHIKRLIINVMLYMFGFHLETDVFLSINKEQQYYEAWLAYHGFGVQKGGGQPANTIRKVRSRNYAVLVGIDGNFMRKPQNYIS